MTTQDKMNNIRYVAQDILSRRDHSEWELAQKLARKGFARPEIDETVAWLKEKKLVNDSLFAKKYIPSIIRTRAVGRRYLTNKLQQKHVEPEAVQAALDELMGLEIEKELASKAATAWKRMHPKFAEDKLRLSRFLLSRGFSGYLLASSDNTIDTE